jgi:hypothetical protein
MQIGAHALLPVVCDTLFLGRLLYLGDSMPASQRWCEALMRPLLRIRGPATVSLHSLARRRLRTFLDLNLSVVHVCQQLVEVAHVEPFSQPGHFMK